MTCERASQYDCMRVLVHAYVCQATAGTGERSREKGAITLAKEPSTDFPVLCPFSTFFWSASASSCTTAGAVVAAATMSRDCTFLPLPTLSVCKRQAAAA